MELKKQKPGKKIAKIYPIKIEFHNYLKIFTISILGFIIICPILFLFTFLNSYPDVISFIALLGFFIMTGFTIFLYKVSKPVIFSNCYLNENGINLNINGYKGFIKYKNINKVFLKKDQDVSNITDDYLLISGKGYTKDIDKVKELIIIQFKEPQLFYYLNRRPEKESEILLEIKESKYIVGLLQTEIHQVPTL